MTKNLIILLFFFTLFSKTHAETKTIHVFVALCDNEFQGVVPVPEKIGNGKDPKLNLYWGAGYGVKSFFKLKTKDWKFVKQFNSSNPFILDRLLFKHSTKDVYLLADAYDGEKIKTCTEDFLKASNSQNGFAIKENDLTLNFGGDSDLIAYVGHDGLMDFEVNITYNKINKKKRDVIILACFSRSYFSPEIRKANANPILWTTHLMAPEAYTLKAAIDGWVNNENGKQIDERAAQAYHKYQKCGIKGARNLFATGFKN
ncbi:hypothetical protein [Aquimarina algicola]|uniref:Uncharacterized protein n=1 Tax=Aquimarina algicola TaxID=2589995 RepID=A0A504JDS5_9FLAO|nr:hypothetical protein [Aquimarina algicola]TPN89206.1 hypothetical protein FHK87_02985 [Aquimarina algicola]